MEATLNSVRHFASTATEIVRKELMKKLQDIVYTLEDVDDTTERFSQAHLQNSVVRAGYDLEVFKHLVSSQDPHGVDQLAATTGADPALLRRILRYLAAIGAIEEAGKDKFSANSVTKNLADAYAEAAIKHTFESIAPQAQAMPEFLRKTEQKNPMDGLHTVFQDAWKTSLTPFTWFAQNPEKFAYFKQTMALRRGPEVSWLTVYPLSDELAASNWADTHNNRAVFVNVGGGIGHQCAQFKEKYSDVPGRVILQDLPQSISQALPTPAVENMSHDFFEEQPVKGAKFYHMRGVLHNQTDSNGQRLLTRIRTAMSPESVLLVDELVLPEQGVDAYSASTDLIMMCAFASMERTEAQWRALFESVGLSLAKTYTYNHATHESVMDVRLV